MTLFGYTIPQLRKAIVAFITPGVVALGAALTSNPLGEPTLSGPEIIAIIVAMVGTGWLVFATKNAAGGPPEPPGVAPA